MNYFNYFTEIEDAFVRRRGKHLLLSPMDWALIESWKEMRVPLHVVLRGIEKSFDSWEAKPRVRTVKSLLYCQEEVEAQYAEWQEAKVGAADVDDAANKQNGEGLPFSRSAILKHLQDAEIGLSHSRKLREGDDFSDALERALALLKELEQDIASTASINAQKLEQSLTGLERMLSDALRATVSADEMAALTTEVTAQLKPYRKQMNASIYEQTFDNLLLKRLRERFNVPRLSLFYLQS